MKKRTVLFIVFMFVVALFFSACSEKKTTEPEKQVAKPTFAPPAGTYTTPQEVLISCATEEAIIKYTIDGTEPGENSLVYVSPIQIESGKTLIAKAFKSDWSDSETAIAQYSLSVAMPTFDPPAGNYIGGQTITISSSTEDAEIFYTIDGSEPSETSLAYSDHIEINISTTIKALAVKTGWDNSDIALAEYTIEIVTDFDGNVYQIIQIGNQLWMAENLKVTHYRNGDPIPNVTDNDEWAGLSTGAYCYYNNSSANGNIYGALYNWYAVDDPRGLAPEGWRVPTDADLTQLTNYLGADAGAKLAGGYELWEDGALRNHPEFDSSGFSFLPGGYRSSSNGAFYNLSNYGNLWSSTEYSSASAWSRYLYYNYTPVSRYYYYKRNGFSVRCVRDLD